MKARERDTIRRDRQKQREREMRLSHMGSETKARVIALDKDRDISEKIALGLAQPSLSKESMYDQRLFNQSEGLSSGFGSSDSYNIYDKPLFAGSSANMVYRPKKLEKESTGVETEALEGMISSGAGVGGNGSRGFQGTEGGESIERSGPVQFEKDESDPFGLDQFLTSAKRGRDGQRSQGDHENTKRYGFNGGSTMRASGSGKKEDYEGSRGDRSIGFQRESKRTRHD